MAWLAISRISFSWAARRTAAAATSSTFVSWIWLIIKGASTSAWNPPPLRIIFAAFDAAATTLGSSTTIGTTRSCPFTRTLSATPKGSAYVPRTFSTTLSAVSASRPPPSSARSTSAGATPLVSATRARRSCTVTL